MSKIECVQDLKQAIQKQIEKCPLVPDLTMMSNIDRLALLPAHSILLDEWYHDLKKLLKIELDGLIAQHAKTTVQIRDELVALVPETPLRLSYNNALWIPYDKFQQKRWVCVGE